MTGLGNIDMRSVVLMRNVKRHTLPLVQVAWLDERPRDRCGRRRSSVTMPGSKRAAPPANKGKTFTREYLQPRDVIALMDACNAKAPFGRRDRSLIAALWRTGMRINCEALRVMPHDVDLQDMTIFVRCGKGSKSRTVVMDQGCADEIAPWLEERKNYPPGPLWCVCEGSTKGGPLGAAYMRKKLKELAALAGIETRVHPHGLRYACAVDMARVMPLHFAQAQLGHSNVATTSIYISATPSGEVHDRLKARVWLPAATGEGEIG